MNKPQSLLDMLNMPPQPGSLSDSVLVIVDAQKEYLEGNVKLTGIEDALVEIQSLLKRAREANTPIFHIVHHTMPGAPIFDPEGPMVDIIDSVKPEANESVIAKNLPSSFVGTDLEEQIKKTNRSNIILSGFMTHMCINATARSAQERSFNTTIVGNACATRELPSTSGETVAAQTVHSSNLASLADLVATIVDSQDSIN